MRAHGQSRSAAARHYALVEKGGQRCRPPLFFVPSFVIFVLIDDQGRTAIERQVASCELSYFRRSSP